MARWRTLPVQAVLGVSTDGRCPLRSSLSGVCFHLNGKRGKCTERFPSLMFAGKIGKKLSGEGKFFELKVFSYQPRSHTSVAHDFSGAQRIVQDTKLSLKVAEALDTEFLRADSTDGIKALLAEPEVSLLTTAHG